MHPDADPKTDRESIINIVEEERKHSWFFTPNSATLPPITTSTSSSTLSSVSSVSPASTTSFIGNE